MGEEQVDGAHHLGLDGVDADQVFEAHLGLARSDERVRRPPGGKEGGQHDRPQHADDEDDRDGGAQPVREVERGEDAVPADPADDDPAEGEGGDRHQAAEAGHPAALPGSGHVGAAQDGVAHDPRDGPAGGGVAAGASSPGRAEAGTFSAGLLMTTPFTPPRTFTNLENPTGPMTLRSDKSHK